jgi:magnesium-transporting ATPase (P-type)
MKEKLYALTFPGGQTVVPPEGIPDGASLSGIITWIVGFLVVVGVVASLIFMLIGAIKWITSGGDAEKLSNARKTVMFAIIGLIVMLLSLVIMNVIEGLLGVSTVNYNEIGS